MKKIALLIGISQYEVEFEPLSSTEKDVEEIKKILQNPHIGQFAEKNITILTNESEQKIQATIYELFKNRNQDDLLLLYFSSHALVNSKGNLFFAATDTKKYEYGGELIESTAIPASFIREQMDASKSQKQVLILDCCFSEAFRNDEITKNTVNIEAELGGKGRAILASSNSIDYDFKEDNELSIYTKYLVEGIEKGDASDGDGWITLEEVDKYIRSKVENIPNMFPKLYSVKESHKIRLAKADIKSIKKSSLASALFEIELLSYRQIDYSRLRELLSTQSWKEADIETRKVMLQAAGKEESEFIIEEDIKNISSLDLRTMDRLWTVASNGHFGFTTQKDIWKQFGERVDYETECELGKYLGWRVNNSWLIHSQLTFNLRAKRGHLPCLGVSLVRLPGNIGGLGRIPILSCIAQRFAMCDI